MRRMTASLAAPRQNCPSELVQMPDQPKLVIMQFEQRQATLSVWGVSFS